MSNAANPYNVGRTLSLRIFGDCPMPGRRTHVARDFHDGSGFACCRCHKLWQKPEAPPMQRVERGVKFPGVPVLKA